MSTKAPFFSVIVPFKNGAPFLRGLICNLQEQPFRDWEAWMIDDGSTDDGARIVEEAIGSDSRFQLVRFKENRGHGAARNFGISHSRGRYVLFVDVDDFLTDDALTRAHSNLQCEPDILFGRAYFLDESGRIIRYSTDPLDMEINSMGDSGEVLLSLFQSGSFWSAWGHVFKRGFLMEHQLGFHAARCAEDYCFMIKAVFPGRKFAVCNEPFYRYRVATQGSLSKGFNMDWDFAQSTIELLEWVNSRDMPDSVRARLKIALAEKFCVNLRRTVAYPLAQRKKLYKLYSSNLAIIALGASHSTRGKMIYYAVRYLGIPLTCRLMTVRHVILHALKRFNTLRLLWKVAHGVGSGNPESGG